MSRKRECGESVGRRILTKRRKPIPTLLDRVLALPQELIDIIYSDFLVSLEEDTIPIWRRIDVDSSYQTPLVLRFNSALRKKYRERYYYTKATFVLPDFATYQKWVASVSEHVEVLGVESKRWECANCQAQCGYEDQFDGKWLCRRHIQRCERGDDKESVTVWWDEVRLV